MLATMVQRGFYTVAVKILIASVSFEGYNACNHYNYMKTILYVESFKTMFADIMPLTVTNRPATNQVLFCSLISKDALSLVSIKVVRIPSTCCRTRFLSFPRMPWSSHSCDDRRYSYFTRSICNRYVESFKTPVRT